MKKEVLVVFTWNPNVNLIGGIRTIIEAYIHASDVFEENGYKLTFFNYSPESDGKHGSVGNVIYGIRQCLAISKYLKNNHVDMIHIHTSREFLFLKDLFLSKYIKSHFSLPIVITIHVGKAETVFNRIHFLKKCILKTLKMYVDRIIFLSEIIRSEFESLGIPHTQTDVLYNFHDLVKIPFFSNYTSAGKLKLLYVGAIQREKGILDLLEGLKLLDDNIYHLDICGVIKDESIRDDFSKSISEMTPTVTMNGVVIGEDKAKLYQESDILILPSYHEGMPMVILEALYSRCAIISTRVGATPEILSDKNVYWVDVQAPEQIASAVKFFVNNRNLLEQMKICNYELSEKYSLKTNIINLCKIYDKSLNYEL